MSFRRRLLAGSVLAVTLAAVLMAGAAYLTTRALLYRQVDNSLRAVAPPELPDTLGAAGGVISGRTIVSPLKQSAPASAATAPALFAVTVDGPHGVPKGIGGPMLPERARRLTKPGDTVIFDATVDGSAVRMFASRMASGALVVVARPIEDLKATLHKLLVILTGLVGLAVVAGLLGARFAARATLAPVAQLTSAAEEIAATRDLAHRVSAARGDDELARMATAFNLMLGALERSQSAQRRLVADASHELRTPLTALRTNMELFLRAGELEPGDQEALRRDVVVGLRELSALIDDLVEAAREEPPLEAERDQVELADVVADAVDQAGRRHPAATFVCEGLEPTTLLGDRHRLARAMTNLLDNAARFSPPGLPIEVTLRDGRVAVRDRGPGIDPADCPHVFDRFYRAVGSRSQPGNGLGLAIVKAVVEGHGGQVRVEAPGGGGARLVIDLSASPLRRDAARLFAGVGSVEAS
jgi:two-component system, OmpR family, sensor histidine kinase MprB